MLTKTITISMASFGMFFLCALTQQSAAAEGMGWFHDENAKSSPLLLNVHDHHEMHEFRERRVHFFSPFELGIWTAGGWVEGWYAGQYGWWWTTGGRRYWYAHPVYPYPPMVSEVWYPQTVVIQPQAPAVVPPPPQGVAVPPSQAQQMWYYCDNPAGYYPYVQSCTVPFRAVPVQPH